MALATYADLKAALANWAHRPSSGVGSNAETLDSIIADCVTLAEARIARDLRLRGQIATATLTTVAGTQTVSLPSDWLETENITLMTSTPKNMVAITPEQMDSRFPAGYASAEPRFYSVIGSTMSLGPTPDAAYSISLDYYQRFAALSGSSTNWLLTNHPGIYLSASLHELAMYLINPEAATQWLAKYTLDVQTLQNIDDAAIRHLPLDDLLARADYVVCLAVANEATESLIGQAALARMQKHACFINLSRGNLVDEAALADALRERRIAGAAMDVGRAPDQMPSPDLAGLPKVIATPHVGGLTPEAIEHQALETARQAAALIRGEIPPGAVNADKATKLARLKR